MRSRAPFSLGTLTDPIVRESGVVSIVTSSIVAVSTIARSRSAAVKVWRVNEGINLNRSRLIKF